ncbi:MAG: hypothetical protein VX121_01150 [Pseudomonadota bacterium]|nr:hypothetical protein [Pseudomonadota bacterium]
MHLKGEYLVTDALGISAGFQLASVDVQENKERGHNRFDVEFSGLTLGVTYSF